MADPISATLAIVGAAVGGFSAFKQTQYNNAAAESESYTARMDAQIMQQNATNEAQNRENQLTESRRKYNLLTGQSRAQAGALGMFGGSSLDVLADQTTQGSFEQKTIVQSTVSSQQNYLNQAAAYKARAQNLLNSRQSPWLNAGLAAIGGLTGSSGALKTGSTGSQNTTGIAGGSPSSDEFMFSGMGY
ncbi:MAG TPA: hypothetical protein VN081_03910 [Dongiaceae bacterium]|nr:hypothetical protein [Dongiaceae bacterium]